MKFMPLPFLFDCRDIAKDLKLIEPRLSLPEIEAQRRREESAQKLKQQPDRKVLQ